MMVRILALALCVVCAANPGRANASVELGQIALGNVFIQGEHIAVAVHAEGTRLLWRVRDFFGTEVASGSGTLSGNAAILEPGVVGPGYFTLDVTAERGGQPAGEAHTTLAIVPAPKPPSGESPFGVMTHFAKGWPTDIISLMERAGIRRVRDEQPWQQVEKDRGEYAFPPRLTDYMSALAAHRIDPLIVLAFANRLYDAGKTPYSDEGRAGYAAYARAVAQKYGSAARAYEVWNEYNGSFCEGPCRANRPAFYAAMLQEAYKTLKAADPSLTVVGGAGVPIPLDFFQGMFEKGALAAMDAIAIHPYRAQPEGVEEKIEALRALMSRYGTPKPIWATEFSDISDMRKNPENAAGYLVRMSTLLLSEKVERIYWYLLRDYREFKGLGLVHDENAPLGRYTPAPAYVAYAMVIHELDGLSFVRREPSDPRTRIYLFAGHDNEIRVAWSAEAGATYDVAGNAPVRYVTMMGGEKSAAPRQGRVSIALDANPIYVIGKASPFGTAAGSFTLASALDDFSLEQGKNGWSYGAILRPAAPLAVGGTVSEPFEPLRPAHAGDRWEYPGSPTLKIEAGMMHPGRSHQAAAWAVRRWSSPEAGAVHVSGAAQVGKKSEGVVFAILVNGRAAYVAELGGSSDANKAEFDLPLTVTQGAVVDFAVGPAASGGVDFDAMHLSAIVSRAAGP